VTQVTLRFADGAHGELFVKDPDLYTPQYDGYCAMGVSAGEAGHKDTVDPEAWRIVVPNDGCSAPELRRIHQTSRRKLGSCQGSGGTGDPRTTLRRVPAFDARRAARRRPLVVVGPETRSLP
jgi:hypothetical protein